MQSPTLEMIVNQSYLQMKNYCMKIDQSINNNDKILIKKFHILKLKKITNNFSKCKNICIKHLHFIINYKVNYNDTN